MSERGTDVLHVMTKGDVGGAQTHVVELARQQIRAGLRVVVAAGSPGPAMSAAEASGARVVQIEHLEHAISPRVDKRAMGAVEALFRETCPAVVHVHSSKAGFIARVVGRRLDVPVVYTAHGWPFQRGAAPAQRIASVAGEATASRMWGEVICLTDHEAALATRWRVVSPRRLHVVPNGLADVPSELLARSVERDTPRIVMIARFAAPKDQDGVLHALSAIRDMPWEMVFAGDGPGLARSRALADRLGLCGRTQFLGRVDDVPSLLSSGQIAVLWSKYEGLPISVLEAMRASLPTIANDLPGTRELLGGASGVVVERKVSALSHALRNLVGDPERRVALGSAARAAFLAKYEISAVEPLVRRVYERAESRPFH